MRSWVQTKADYVEGRTNNEGEVIWSSLDQVATANGFKPQTVRERAAKEGWTTERAAFQRRVEHQRQERRSNELSRLGADLDVQALRIARSGLAVTAVRIQELVREAEGRARQPANGTPTGNPLDSLEMDRLARASAEWYGLGVRALGEAPRFAVELIEPEVPAVEERDARSVALMAILIDNGLAPKELGEVIDVSSGRLRDISGNGQGPDSGSVDTADERLHSVNVDGDEPEPETNGLSAT